MTLPGRPAAGDPAADPRRPPWSGAPVGDPAGNPAGADGDILGEAARPSPGNRPEESR